MSAPYRNSYRRFHVNCITCGHVTNRRYAEQHDMRCLQCAEPDRFRPRCLTQQDVEARFAGGPAGLTDESLPLPPY